jgi:hypothetical protein
MTRKQDSAKASGLQRGDEGAGDFLRPLIREDSVPASNL